MKDTIKHLVGAFMFITLLITPYFIMNIYYLVFYTTALVYAVAQSYKEVIEEQKNKKD